MYCSSLCEILRLEAHASKQDCRKIDFCHFKRDKGDANLWDLPNSPANSDVTWRYFFYNLLEFSTPLDCKGSRVVYTSPINTKKILLCSQLDIT